MKSIAILPLRKGSKGIPGKNKRKILGRPLYQWVLGEAILSKLNTIYVFTDDDDIIDFVTAEYTWTDKIKCIKRSDSSAGDTASTEEAMIELSEIINHDYDIYCLLQATSPLTTSNDINNCLQQISSGEYESSLTAVRTKRFLWNHEGTPINYNFLSRPRRQDFDGILVENGAVYSCTKSNFQKYKNRLGGKIGIVEMNEDSLSEIDEPSDFLIVEQLLKTRVQHNKQKSTIIKALVLDVDGVLADGTVLTGTKGEIAKSFSLRDGMGISFLIPEGIIPIIMTSEYSDIVHTRIKKLCIRHYYPGVRDKYSKLTSVLQELGIARSETAYIGDDINDLANMLAVGWSFSPHNAVNTIHHNSDVKLNHLGGDMAVREAIEFIIEFNKRF